MPGRSNESDLAVTLVDKVAVQELRNKISDVISDDQKFDNDFYLTLWLKAQKFNAEKTELMIRKSLAWRKEQKLDTDIPAEFQKEFEFSFYKAKDGRPVVHCNVGTMDFLKGIQTHGEEYMVKNWTKCLVQMEEKWIEYSFEVQNNQGGINVGEALPALTSVVNAKDFPYAQVAKLDVINFALKVAKNLLAYFPAMFDHITYVNMNKFMDILVSAVLPIISGSMTIETYGEDSDKWKPQLLKYLDEEVVDRMHL